MTQAHRVVMTIKPGGEVTTTVEGISGAACEAATKWLDGLGEVTEHKRTPDYYAHTSEQTVEETATVGTGNDDEGGSHGSPW